MEHRYRGHQIGLGSHLVEDPGDSLTRACEYIGVDMVHSARSDSMPFWDKTGWKPIQEYYGGEAKQGLKRCIEALTETSFSELDTLDHCRCASGCRGTPPTRASTRCGRRSRCSSRSPSTGGSTRPRRTSSPQAALRAQAHRRLLVLADGRVGVAVEARGRPRSRVSAATLHRPETVERVIVERGGGQACAADEGPGRAARGRRGGGQRARLGHAGAVRRRRAAVGPDAAHQAAGQQPNKACWIGYWIAAEEPVIASSELEMASFFATPRTGLPGFTLNFTGYDPGVSPRAST